MAKRQNDCQHPLWSRGWPTASCCGGARRSPAEERTEKTPLPPPPPPPRPAPAHFVAAADTLAPTRVGQNDGSVELGLTRPLQLRPQPSGRKSARNRAGQETRGEAELDGRLGGGAGPGALNVHASGGDERLKWAEAADGELSGSRGPVKSGRVGGAPVWLGGSAAAADATAAKPKEGSAETHETRSAQETFGTRPRSVGRLVQEQRRAAGSAPNTRPFPGGPAVPLTHSQCHCPACPILACTRPRLIGSVHNRRTQRHERLRLLCLPCLVKSPHHLQFGQRRVGLHRG